MKKKKETCVIGGFILSLRLFERVAEDHFPISLFHNLYDSLNIVILDTHCFTLAVPLHIELLHFIAHLLRIRLSGSYKLTSFLNLL